MNSPLVVGFLACFTLIAAIGAQNAFVLRQGIQREHVLPVVALCTVSDIVLIAAGIAGFGALIGAHPRALNVVKFGGAAFLIGYGHTRVGPRDRRWAHTVRQEGARSVCTTQSPADTPTAASPGRVGATSAHSA